MPLLREGAVDYAGRSAQLYQRTVVPETIASEVPVRSRGSRTPGAGGHRQTGGRHDACLGWTHGPIREHISPATFGSRSRSFSAPPRAVIATLPVCVTENEAKVRQSCHRQRA